MNPNFSHENRFNNPLSYEVFILEIQNKLHLLNGFQHPPYKPPRPIYT
jgi:hypothetical protein